MNTVWFDASYHQEKKVATIGIYIESKEKNIVYKETTIKEKVKGSTEAEMWALLIAIQRVKYLNFTQPTLIYGDSLSVIRSIKYNEMKKHYIYKQCYNIMEKWNVEKNMFQWIERRYNRADYLTRQKPKKEIIDLKKNETMINQKKEKKEEENHFFELTLEAYQHYIKKVKGDTRLPFRVAERKINRNIRQVKKCVIPLTNNEKVYLYYSLFIFIKDNQIIKIENIGNENKGFKYYLENKEELKIYR